MKIILTGATGLIGSRFEELMFETHEIIPLSSSHGVDITDRNSIEDYIKGKDFDVVVHFAAKTDVDQCELDKTTDMLLLEATENSLMDLDISSIEPSVFKNKKSAVAINFIGTKNLYDVSQDYGKKFIYISTDFVFSGKEKFNTEESVPQPVDWYGTSKYLGERVIDISSNLIVRLSFPYGYPSPVKPDFVQKLIGLLKDRDEVSLIEDQTITPTFIDDIIEGLDFLLSKNATGIFHLTGSSYEDPYYIGQMIKNEFGLNTKINPATREQIYSGKAPRPFQSIMKNDKIKSLGFTPKTLEEGFELLKNSI